jgi:hypothetical protein
MLLLLWFCLEAKIRIIEYGQREYSFKLNTRISCNQGLWILGIRVELPVLVLFLYRRSGYICAVVFSAGSCYSVALRVGMPREKNLAVP